MGEQHNFRSKIHLEPKMVKIDSIMVCSPTQALIIQPSLPGFVSNNICTSGDLPFFDSAVFHSKRRCSALCDEEIRVLLWNCFIRKDWNSLFIWEFSQVSFELISLFVFNPFKPNIDQLLFSPRRSIQNLTQEKGEFMNWSGFSCSFSPGLTTSQIGHAYKKTYDVLKFGLWLI